MWDGFSTRPPPEGWWRATADGWRTRPTSAGRTRTLLEQIRLEALRGHRRAEEEALNAVAALVVEEFELLLGLHPFGDDLEIEAVSHVDDRADDGGAL